MRFAFYKISLARQITQTNLAWIWSMLENICETAKCVILLMPPFTEILLLPDTCVDRKKTFHDMLM